MEPRIVVTASEGAKAEEYLEALREAGARPVLVRPADDDARDVDALLAHAHALLVSGGVDIEPKRYGGADSPLISAARIRHAASRKDGKPERGLIEEHVVKIDPDSLLAHGASRAIFRAFAEAARRSARGAANAGSPPERLPHAAADSIQRTERAATR